MFSPEIPKEVLQTFVVCHFKPVVVETGKISIHPIGAGLINRSYRLEYAGYGSVFLQQLNTTVFPDPQRVQDNYLQLWHFSEFEFTGQRMPAPVFTGEEQTLYYDTAGNAWRGFEFITGTITIEKVDSPAQAVSLAMAFARFTASFRDFDPHLLQEVIPGFHDLSARFRQFEQALQSEWYERRDKARDLIDDLKKRERYCSFFEEIRDAGTFPLRVMHHDAKMSNILFSQETGQFVCLVDYDTVMPGYFFSDLGDMIRSCCSTEPETSKEAEKIRVKESIYEGLVQGYLSGMEEVLTATEKKYIHYSGLLLIYMQALRFLTDYLQGDRYYRVEYAEQNYDRARNQLALLVQLELFLQEQQKIVLWVP